MQQTPDMALTAALAQYSDWFVMRDILIPADEDRTMHIDFLIVAQHCIFVGELKTFQGKIIGSGMNKYWKHLVGGQEIDYFSPLLQNLYHIKYLREFLKPVPYELHFHSLVMMQGLNPAAAVQIQGPFPPDSSIVQSYASLRRITQMVSERRKMNLTFDEARYLYDYIGENQLRGEDARAKHAAESAEYKLNARKALMHQICPECNSPLKQAATPQGNLWICSRWPQCKYTHKL